MVYLGWNETRKCAGFDETTENGDTTHDRNDLVMSLGKRNITKRTVQNRTCGTIRCVDEKYEGTNNRRVEKRKDCDFCECTMISTHVSKEKETF